MEKKKKEKILLIDSSALMYKAFYALPPLKNKKGEQVNAVYGFFLTLIKALEDKEPDYLVATFDLPKKTFRHKRYKLYKAHRPETPKELIEQIPKVKKGIKMLGIPVLEKEGYEADDIIGTLTKRWKKKIDEIIIMTEDRDLLQLVDEKVKVASSLRGKKDLFIFNRKEVEEKYGLPPSLLVDFKALCGDPSDNIPGVKGVGKKTACKLIKEFGSVEKIYSSLEKIEPSLRKKLEENKKEAFLSKELSLIEKDVPLEISISKARFQFKKENLIPFLEEMNFKAILKRIEEKNMSLF